jgi:hypothetical protein
MNNIIFTLLQEQISQELTTPNKQITPAHPCNHGAGLPKHAAMLWTIPRQHLLLWM